MSLDIELFIDVSIPIFTLILGFFLNRWFEKRPKVIVYLGHISDFDLDLQDQPNKVKVYTHSIVLKNAGKLPAENVRVGHHLLPNYKVTPTVEYKINSLSNDSKEIIFPTLIPNEQVTISYLYFTPLKVDNINSHIKSDEGFSKVVTVLPTIQYPAWVNRIIFCVLIAGTISIVYLLINLCITFCEWLLR